MKRKKYFCQTCGAEIGISYVITCNKIFCTSECANAHLNTIVGEKKETKNCDWTCCHCGTSYSDSIQCAEFMGSCVCETCVKKDFIEEDGELVLKTKNDGGGK